MYYMVPFVTAMYSIVQYSINYKKKIFLKDYLLETVLNYAKLYCTQPKFTPCSLYGIQQIKTNNIGDVCTTSGGFANIYIDLQGNKIITLPI